MAAHVQMAVDNSPKLQFRVLYKFPKMPLVRTDYFVRNLAELSRVLYHAEGVTRESVDYLYVHQVHRNGDVAEIIALETRGSSRANVNPHMIMSSADTKVPLPKGGFTTGNPKDDKVISAVYNILQKQAKENVLPKGNEPAPIQVIPKKPENQVAKPKIKLTEKPGRIMAGLYYSAFPAPTKKKE